MKYLVIILLAFSLFPQASFAASGCCGIASPSSPDLRYVTSSNEECATLNASYAGSNFTFKEGEQATKDNKNCEKANTETLESGPSKIVPPVLSVSVPGFIKFSDVECSDSATDCEIPWLAEYIKAIYNYGILIVGILSVIVMMIGGVMRIVAAGNNEQIGHANTYIKSSVLGLILAICSYLILFLVNPNLTILKSINVRYLPGVDIPEGEPVDIITLTSSPEGGEFSLDQSSWKLIPQTPGVCMNSGSRAAPAFIEKLKQAGACLNAQNPSWCISGTAARDISSQVNLYSENCHNGKCNPPTCNPYPLGVKICPHTSGSAADLNRRVSFYSQASKCLKAAGFCRLCSEAWHWEYPKMSSGCTCQ